jgi:hypothetical protein
MTLFFGIIFAGCMVWGVLLGIGALLGLVVQGNWKAAAIIVGAFVDAGVVGLILGEFIGFVSKAMSTY